MQMKRKSKLISYLRRSLKSISFIILVLLFIYLAYQIGIENIRGQVEGMGAWIPLVLFLLRFTSIIIPALPSTAYSLLSGGLLGFKLGIIIICLADLISCSICFLISRFYGKDFIRKFVGKRFIYKIEELSEKHLESNFFLMTGFLMTGLFDFVSYAIGLTKTPWKKFIPALIISISLSNPPVVALGAGLLVGGKKLVFIALACIFVLAFISAKIKPYRSSKNNILG